MSYNEFTYISEKIGSLKELKSLDICCNFIEKNIKNRHKLKKLPESITHLKNLKNITLPEKVELSKIQKKWLIQLKQKGCKVLPYHFVYPEGYKFMSDEETLLDIINLHRVNPISLQGLSRMRDTQEISDAFDHTLPKEIKVLKHMKKLIIDTKISYIPYEIGELVDLEKLYLNRLNVAKLPHSIKRLRKLKVLHIQNEKKLKLSSAQKKWLKELQKRGCKITGIIQPISL